ncbi:MAG: hypothetical protein ACFE9S_07550 [Candidatus Hermodarchaeota archaeon]
MGKKRKNNIWLYNCTSNSNKLYNCTSHLNIGDNHGKTIEGKIA